MLKISESYFCIYCMKEIFCEDGIFIHDDVFHPHNFDPDDEKVEN